MLLDGQKYRKGLAVHARTVLHYALDGRFETFQARLGFDDAAPSGGSVACRVVADDRELFNNPALRQEAESALLKLDVANVKQLVLEVDFGEAADVGDRITWGGARVFRPTPPAATAVTTSPPAPPSQP